MLIAALDSTAVTASAAVAEFTGGRLGGFALFTVKNKLTHSETLLPLLEQALTQFGVKVGDIDAFAVSAGPGSFTGVRIGAATVKGLAFAENKPCVSVSALEALAENVNHGVVCPLMDARRDQFYTAIFENGSRITDDDALSKEEIFDRLSKYGRVTLCGDGAEKFAALYPEASNLTVAPAASRDQNALSVAMCAYRKYEAGEAVSAAELAPIYLRMPQAERERIEKEKSEEIK